MISLLSLLLIGLGYSTFIFFLPLFKFFLGLGLILGIILAIIILTYIIIFKKK